MGVVNGAGHDTYKWVWLRHKKVWFFVSSLVGVHGGSVGVAIQQNKMADNSLDENEEDFASAESDQEEKVS